MSIKSGEAEPESRVPAGGAPEGTAPAKAASPVDFWLGLFLLLYSGGYLSVGLRLADYVTRPAKIGAVAWSVFGAALFVAGGLVFTRGLAFRSTRVALTASAVLYAVRAVFGTFSAGNPFASLPSFLGKLEVGLGLAADLALGVTAAWLVVAVALPGTGEDRRFGRTGLAFLGAFAFQAAVIPLADLVLRLLSVPDLLRATLTSGPFYVVREVPTLVRGLAGIVGLVAVWRAARRWTAPGPAPWATGLWALADLALVGALWMSWMQPTAAVTPSTPAAIRTTLFVLLPALALFGLAATLRPKKV